MSRRVPPRGFFDGESPFGRLPVEPGFPTLRLPRRTVFWALIAAGALVLVLLAHHLASLYTDWLWFRALGYANVFTTRFWTQLLAFFLFAAIFWVVGAANVLVALGSGRRLSTIGIRQRLLTSPSSILSLLGVFLLGLIFGRIAAGQWQTILSYFKQVPFGTSDPVWHQDVAFYLFSLPFYRFVWGWLLGVSIVMALISAALYAYRTGMQSLVLTARAMRHLTLLAAAFAALIAVNYRLDLYELLLSRRGFVFGAGYTDVTARIPGYWIMTVLLALIAIALAANPATVENARLWDPQLALPQTLEALQGLRPYYNFSQIAVDRYTIDGRYLQFLLAARELNTPGLSSNAQSWVNLKLQYTHGDGVAAVRANQATDQGNPVLTLQNIPPSGVPIVTQPGIYFGRNSSDYVLADSRTPEFDYPAATDKNTHSTRPTSVALIPGLHLL